MNWHSVTVAGLVLAVVGCGSDRSLLAAGTEPGTNVSGPASTSRLQKPEPVEAPQPSPTEGEVAVKVRAHVNGLPILDDELRQACYPQLMAIASLPEPERSTRQTQIMRAELEKIIERELILDDALARLGKRQQAMDKLREAAGKEFDKLVKSYKERARAQGLDVDTDEKFEALLAQQSMNIDGLRRQSERSFMAMEYMRHRIYPSIEKMGHKELRQYYDEHPGEFQAIDRVKWQDIFIAAAKHPSRSAAKAHAEQIAARVRAGEDFATLAKQYGDGISNSGEGYGQRRGEIMPREVEPILFRMREGEVGPVVEQETGYHVIKVVEREYAGQQPFDEKVQSEIKRKLQGVIADREYKRLVNELRRKASVQIVE